MEENSIIEEALPILRNNVDAICTVGEWAEQTGYSRTHFSMLIRREFNDTPLLYYLSGKIPENLPADSK